eukprot:augustus_masked-scaffold_19-processed-gene-6.16-mRNA-1 protein AED:0.27 eAED:0.27 QI:0/-1/0/1/-1/1/1/0/129
MTTVETTAETTEDKFNAQEYAAHCAQKLKNNLESLHLCVVDVTDGHTVAGYNDGSNRAQFPGAIELHVLAVSEAFEELNLVKRHQMITNILKEEFSSGKLHAVQIKAWTPKQWEKKGKPKKVKPENCLL